MAENTIENGELSQIIAIYQLKVGKFLNKIKNIFQKLSCYGMEVEMRTGGQSSILVLFYVRQMRLLQGRCLDLVFIMPQKQENR